MYFHRTKVGWKDLRERKVMPALNRNVPGYHSMLFRIHCGKGKVENIKHRLNSNGQARTTADTCKIVENLMSSQPIANAVVVGSIRPSSSF